ncbi:helix-turn-helix domain-containing protein [Mesorhizobium sp. M0184]|uniref:IclR family transcriptional regulator n=1 Tax=Mesorhizobium sp. M0184 TaxID=2956906 RepID=UPI00333657FF
MRRQINKIETEHVKSAQLLDRSVALLNYLAEVGDEGARVHEMAKTFGLTMSTTHRIVSALERHLLLERDPSTRRYRLGLLLYTLGVKAVESTTLRRCCRPALLRLAAKTGNSVSLVARSGFHSVCLDWQEGTYPIDSVARHMCSQVPLGVGSASLAILAFLPPEEANGIISADAHPIGDINTTQLFEELCVKFPIRFARKQYKTRRSLRISPVSASQTPPPAGRAEVELLV